MCNTYIYWRTGMKLGVQKANTFVQYIFSFKQKKCYQTDTYCHIMLGQSIKLIDLFTALAIPFV